MSRLDGHAVDEALAELGDWERDGDAIVRELHFETFRDAIAFIVRVADVAEAADHHPELTNVYANVEVRLTSHDVGGVTDRDVSLARAIDEVVVV